MNKIYHIVGGLIGSMLICASMIGVSQFIFSSLGMRTTPRVHAQYSPIFIQEIQERVIERIDRVLGGQYRPIVRVLEQKAGELGNTPRGILLADLAQGIQEHYNTELTSVTETQATEIKSSLGCERTAPSAAPTRIPLQDGSSRAVITDIGSAYSPDTPIPLIIAFHGRTNSNTQVQRYYDLDEATQGNAIIVYPSGLPENSSPRNRRSGNDPSDQLRDFALFDAIVDHMSEQYCIDQERIYAVGHSLGARFSNTLACARGDVLRGIGTVGGGITPNTCQSPTAAIIMHHPEDKLSSFSSGIAARDVLLEQNQCSEETTPVGPDWANCVQYNCESDNPVVRCPHSDSTAYNGSYYPHTRPDNAAQEIWNFFQSLE